MKWRINGKQKTISIGNSSAIYVTEDWKDYAQVSSLFGEQPVIEDLISNLRSDDVFWDVGANIGLYTCLVGSQIDSGEIISFEPHPSNLNKLKKNISTNELEVYIKNVALSDTDGELLLDDDGVTHTLSISNPPDGKEYNVPIEIGDSIDDVPTPSIIKIDVEGEEQAVLRGLEETLKSVRLIYVESHTDHSKRPTEQNIPTQLREYGFEVEDISTNTNNSYIRGTRI